MGISNDDEIEEQISSLMMNYFIENSLKSNMPMNIWKSWLISEYLGKFVIYNFFYIDVNL